MHVCMYKPNQFCSLLVRVTDSQRLPLSLITIPYRLNQRSMDENGRTKVETRLSVLISLISDTWTNGPHDIKLISLGEGSTTVACYWGSCASLKRCTTAWAWRIPPNLVRT
ncbi:hypothetical protein ACE6H2_001305 [Prunus campanulata]